MGKIVQQERESKKVSAGRELTVAVVGLGKMGLPLAVAYLRKGCRVIGCDVNQQVVEAINAGVCHIREEPGLAAVVAEAVSQGMLSATQDTTSAVRASDVVVVIVPVITNEQGEIDYGAIDAATAAIGAGLTPGKLVIYETTLPVGTTAQRLRQHLEQCAQLTAGEDFSLAYSPERVRSGQVLRDLATYPKVVGGINAASTKAAAQFYRAVLDAEVIETAHTNEAEFVKLIETTYRDVNIALANEFACYADAHGLDLHAAIAAANSQPQSHIHEPGLGVGGHCIPIYPYFLFHSAAAGLELARQARVINDSMATFAIERIEAEFGPLASQSVLILGITYRGNVRETTCSTAHILQKGLAARGASVYAHDPLFSDSELERLGYTPLQPEHREKIDLMILQANHAEYRDWDFRQFPNCRLVLDGRRALRREQITAHGMRYLSIGDGRRARAGTGEPPGKPSDESSGEPSGEPSHAVSKNYSILSAD
jgi:nucleotide sugar dehydrogenase